ncbi:MAG: cytochrome d ubiquinol oxidase subunit II [bacterium]
MLLLWFALWGLLWGVYFLLDGFDLGGGILLPFLGKHERDRRNVYGSIGPFWDGNEVWLVAAGGITFAAFPLAYAVMFSALYSPLMIILFSLIIRGAAVVLREHSESAGVKRLWDRLFFLSSLTAAFFFGLTFANLFAGIPINENGVLEGSLGSFFNGYGIVGGLLFLFLFSFHGALWLALKSEGDLEDRAARVAMKLWWGLVAVAVLFLVMTRVSTELYSNYTSRPGLFVIPAVLVVALLAGGYMAYRRRFVWAWAAQAVTILYTVFFGLFGIFPALVPSSLHPAYSINLAEAASGPKTLKIMLAVVIVFIPIVVIYQSWVYHIFKGKIKEEDGYGY